MTQLTTAPPVLFIRKSPDDLRGAKYELHEELTDLSVAYYIRKDVINRTDIKKILLTTITSKRGGFANLATLELAYETEAKMRQAINAYADEVLARAKLIDLGYTARIASEKLRVLIKDSATPKQRVEKGEQLLLAYEEACKKVDAVEEIRVYMEHGQRISLMLRKINHMSPICSKLTAFTGDITWG